MSTFAHPSETGFKRTARVAGVRILSAATALAAGLMLSLSVSAKPIEIHIGVNTPIGNPEVDATFELAKLITERSNGELVAKAYPGGQLGNEQQMLENMQVGTLDMSVIIGATYGNILPEANVLGMLYVFQSINHMRAAMRGAPGEKLAELALKKTGIHILDASWYYGTRQLTSNRPIKTPSDFHDFKLRVVPVPIFQAGWKMEGAIPTPVDFKDLFTALQTNVVDGQENPLTNSKAVGAFLVNKNLTLTDHLIANVIVGMSDDLYQRLTPSQRKLILDITHEVGDRESKVAKDSEERLVKEIEKEGVNVIYPDVSLFREKVKDLPTSFEGGRLLPLYNEIQKYAKTN